MKNTLLALAILFLFPLCSFGQDVIIMKNGDEIKSKVTEIGTSEIKYKKFDNADGPVISILKSDVFMIKYQNGTKDVFNEKSSGENNNSAPAKTKNEPAVADKKYRALFYAGVSIPVGAFSSTTYEYAPSSAKIGGCIGHEGDLLISDNAVYFSYLLNYAYQPYKVPFFDASNPYGFPGLTYLEGNYNLFYGLIGFKFKSHPSKSRFYGLFSGGLNVYSISGDLADFSENSSGFSSSVKVTGGNSFAFCVGMGAEINNKFNIGLRYLNSKPKYTATGTVSYYDPYSGTVIYESVSEPGEQKIELFQMVFGYEF